VNSLLPPPLSGAFLLPFYYSDQILCVPHVDQGRWVALTEVAPHD
jgi:hypothetical protein